MSAEGMMLAATVIRTNFFGSAAETREDVQLAWPDARSATTADELREALLAMLRGCGHESLTPVVLEGMGSAGWKLPDNLFLNQIPCDVDIRDWFYRDVCDAVQVALEDESLVSACQGRLRIECLPPELNPEMDTFRSGTMLELVREQYMCT